MLKKIINAFASHVPERSDFPSEARFYIKEFDVPLVLVTKNNEATWMNWYGGQAKKYASTSLKPGNNWEAESFEEWQQIVKDSL